MAFDDPIVFLIGLILIILVLAIILTARRGKVVSGAAPLPPRNWDRTIAYILILVGIVSFFTQGFFFFGPFGSIFLLIIGLVLLWTSGSRNQMVGASGEVVSRPKSSKWMRRIVIIVAVTSIAIFAGTAIVNSAYNSYLNDAMLPYQPQFHYPEIGSAITRGTVVQARSYSIPGFLGIGTTLKEDIAVFVPSTGGNFSQSFLYCSPFQVGDPVSVQVSAYNTTYSEYGFFPFPTSNYTTIASSAVTNTSLDKTITIVSNQTTITAIDEVGRDYSVTNVPNSCTTF